MGREAALAAVGAALVGLGALRAMPRSGDATPLRCAPEQVGRDGALALCGGRGALTAGEARVLGLPLDLNRASEQELEALPGIGPALAHRIASDRDARGPFRTIDDLERVEGIGPGKRRALQGLVTAGTDIVERLH